MNQDETGADSNVIKSRQTPLPALEITNLQETLFRKETFPSQDRGLVIGRLTRQFLCLKAASLAENEAEALMRQMLTAVPHSGAASPGFVFDLIEMDLTHGSHPRPGCAEL